MSKGILLVEDDENDAFFFLHSIQKLQIPNPIQVVRDGKEAIDYLAGEAPYSDRTRFPLPSLVLLDLNLPRQHGLEVLEWIRRQPRLNGIIVVILTSSRAERDLANAYRLGANSYLLKPSDPLRLFDLVGLIRDYWLGLNQFPPRNEPR